MTELKSFSATPWLMIEAYDDVSTADWCKPVDPNGSGKITSTLVL